MIDGLVAAGFDPSLWSVAVRVAEPSVLRVMLKFWLPATRLVLAGNEAAASLELRPTKSVAVATLFQFASTALTVTEKDSPRFCCEGEPVLPVAVPGAAVSPGTSN